MSDEVFYLAQMFHEAAPTEGLGGDRPMPPPTEVIDLGQADALTVPPVGRDAPARLTVDGAGPEDSAAVLAEAARLVLAADADHPRGESVGPAWVALRAALLLYDIRTGRIGDQK